MPYIELLGSVHQDLRCWLYKLVFNATPLFSLLLHAAIEKRTE
jgi:hypothetical protein